MNMEAMNRTLAALKAGDPETFNMQSHDTCMLRYVWLANGQRNEDAIFTRNKDVMSCSTSTAAQILDIDYEDSYNLFINFSGASGSRGQDITLDQAIKVFENFKDTGKANWSIISDDEDDSGDAILEEQLAEIRLGDEGPIYEK